MSTLCKYVIIRFMPFAETEEFANVGVLLFAPKLGFADFILAPSRFARVTNFFDDLDGALYSNALNSFTYELERVRDLGRCMYGVEQVNFFQEVTRFREGVMTFGEMSSMLCHTPEIALRELFDSYVGRSFATKEYREQQMVKLLRHELKANVNTVKFRQQKLIADYVSVNMPFVANIGNITKVIKPIAFDQEKPLNLIEHGEQWISRVKRLIHAKAIKAEHMMFTVEQPRRDSINIWKAYKEVSNEMLALGVNVTEFENKKSIYTFASNLHNDEPFILKN